KWGRQVRQRLLSEVGIPVSMGIAPTKTLAKLARERAKSLGGVLDLASLNPAERQAHLARTDISGVWGVGWRLAPRLRAEGLHSALDLAGMRPQLASQLMGVHGRRLVAELNGQACHPLEMQGRVRQSIMHGRMFGNDTQEFTVIEAAIVSLTARAAFGLRKSDLLARRASLMISTNRSLPGYQRQQHTVQLPRPTADTGLIASQLVDLAQALFRPELRYHRANILLFDLVSDQAVQADLLGLVDLAASDQSSARLQAVDQLNSRYGKNTVRFAAEDLSQAWQPKHNSRSPRYTTAWDELPIARLMD
ncbi:MAG TPA: DUF4113 domain-containing protein, partial [Candidatus Saccharimonadales bacterium]|nr:DUF4113 domain-containing protein [Candidatus Saccharimonadales bacterium]